MERRSFVTETRRSAEAAGHSFRRAQGADVIDGGVEYRVWSEHSLHAVVVDPSGEPLREVPLSMRDDGIQTGFDELGEHDDLYFYRLPNDQLLPDPASRFQPLGVHGPSQVIDQRRYHWEDNGWQTPPLQELVLYELHVGAFTREGTFAAAILKLPYLRELGITAIELMPIGDFPGTAIGAMTEFQYTRRRACMARRTICARWSMPPTRMGSR